MESLLFTLILFKKGVMFCLCIELLTSKDGSAIVSLQGKLCTPILFVIQKRMNKIACMVELYHELDLSLEPPGRQTTHHIF